MTTGNYLKRTNQTSLLDEELLILDVLFDSRDVFESFLKENYASWHNLPYSHDLDTGTVREVIDKLLVNGIIRPDHPGLDSRGFYGLTEAGGTLWELERAPDWERYCADFSTVDEDESMTLTIESPSISTANAFMVGAMDCNLYRFERDAIRTATSMDTNLSTVDWRIFQSVYTLSTTTYPVPATNHVEWDEYEKIRSWWRNLTELARFQLL